MTKIEQFREALEAAKHAMTNQRYLLPRLGTEDAHAKVTSALAILKDMDGQGPVSEHLPTLPSEEDVKRWFQLLVGIGPDAMHNDIGLWASNDPAWRNYHPSPSAPVDIAEIIKAGDVMHEAMVRYQMDVDDDPPMKHRDMMEAWTEATAKHRTT